MQPCTHSIHSTAWLNTFMDSMWIYDWHCVNTPLVFLCQHVQCAAWMWQSCPAGVSVITQVILYEVLFSVSPKLALFEMAYWLVKLADHKYIKQHYLFSSKKKKKEYKCKLCQFVCMKWNICVHIAFNINVQYSL